MFWYFCDCSCKLHLIVCFTVVVHNFITIVPGSIVLLKPFICYLTLVHLYLFHLSIANENVNQLAFCFKFRFSFYLYQRWFKLIQLSNAVYPYNTTAFKNECVVLFVLFYFMYLKCVSVMFISFLLISIIIYLFIVFVLE